MTTYHHLLFAPLCPSLTSLLKSKPPMLESVAHSGVDNPVAVLEASLSINDPPPHVLHPAKDDSSDNLDPPDEDTSERMGQSATSSNSRTPGGGSADRRFLLLGCCYMPTCLGQKHRPHQYHSLSCGRGSTQSAAGIPPPTSVKKLPPHIPVTSVFQLHPPTMPMPLYRPLRNALVNILSAQHHSLSLSLSLSLSPALSGMPADARTHTAPLSSSPRLTLCRSCFRIGDPSFLSLPSPNHAPYPACHHPRTCFAGPSV